MQDFLEIKPCEICGSQEAKPLYEWPAEYFSHEEYETSSWDGRENIPLKIVSCTNCGLVYTSPSFKEEHLGKVYPEDIIGEDIDLDRRFSENIAKHHDLIEYVKKHRKDGTFLDIGTRLGVLPYLAQKQGYDAYGIDYNEAAIRAGRTKFKKLYAGTPATALPKTGVEHFDIIVMDDVLEHLVHPIRELNTISKYQKTGGLLFLRQMDLDSQGYKRYGKDWYYLQPAAHQYYFDSKTIKTLLEKAGYTMVKIYRPSNMKNTVLTLALRLKRMVSGPDILKENGKLLYLNQRKKTFDDMCLVVAKRE